ncbi:hypothetical protein KAU33_04110 [Candidatus Dependentiae bacterium]|nr:hypothetical protein [Candidatus Dependentiae bacterium]
MLEDTFKEFTGDWDELLGGETNAELRLNKPTQVGTYEATLLEVIHDDSYHATVEFVKDNLVKKVRLNVKRYDIKDGNIIRVRGINLDPEKINLDIKEKD